MSGLRKRFLLKKNLQNYKFWNEFEFKIVGHKTKIFIEKNRRNYKIWNEFEVVGLSNKNFIEKILRNYKFWHEFEFNVVGLKNKNFIKKNNQLQILQEKLLPSLPAKCRCRPYETNILLEKEFVFLSSCSTLRTRILLVKQIYNMP